MINEHPLAKALREAGVTQSDLSTEARVPQPQISQVIGRRRDRFGPEAAARILEFFSKRNVMIADDDGQRRALRLDDLVLVAPDTVGAQHQEHRVDPVREAEGDEPTMTRSDLGRIETVNVRTAFAHESINFTTWLEEHIDVLGERLGLKLSVEQREKQVGDFNVDLLCEDGEGHRVIVENQLERTDHDHLGKLLTYLVNLDAKTAIWVTPEPRIEHRRVIDWLNKYAAETDFFLVKVEAIRIGKSPLAPLFTVLVAPDAQTREIGETDKDWAARHYKLLEFWKTLLAHSKDKTRLFANITPGRYYYIQTGAGRAGVTFQYQVTRTAGFVVLYIDIDKESGEANKRMFDAIQAQQADIEREFGGPMIWERLDDKRASQVLLKFTDGGVESPETWPRLQDKMIDAMIRFYEVLRPRVLKIET